MSYDGFADNLDQKLETTAEKFEGELYGSGYGLESGERDMGFGFYDLKKATQFVSAARKFKAVQSIYSSSHLYEDDGCPFH